MSQDYKGKFYGEVGDITRIQIRTETHGRKRFRSALGGVVHKIMGENRPSLSHQIFTNLHHNLYEYGSLRGDRHSEGGPPVTRTLSMEPNVLDTVRGSLDGVGAIAAAISDFFDTRNLLRCI
ncbi:hypothetical protein TNCV_4507491 [Trichonephila clavipes]|nr:hypothetical protein TNCV_4507491 [Trichonephila clavipes]